MAASVNSSSAMGGHFDQTVKKQRISSCSGKYINICTTGYSFPSDIPEHSLYKVYLLQMLLDLAFILLRSMNVAFHSQSLSFR